MPTISVACIGDTHIQGSHPRNDDRLAAFDHALDAALALPDLKAVVHMGDVFHSESSPDDRLQVAQRLQRAADVVATLEVEGNHGRRGDTSLQERLHARNPIHVVTQPQLLVINGIMFAVLPYPSKAAMVAAGATREAQVQIAHDAFDLIAMQDTGKAWQEWRGPKMVVGHLTIAGAVTSVGQPLVAAELEMDPATLTRYGNVPKVFGHIHKHQVVGDAVYVGSSCRMDWGETERKGWLHVQFTYDDQPVPDMRHHWSFRELPVPPMYHVQGTLSRDVYEWQVRKGPDGPVDTLPTGRIKCHACAGVAVHARQDDLLGQLDDVTDATLQLADTLLCATCNGQGELVDWTGCDVRVRAKYPASERLVHDDTKAKLKLRFPNARIIDIELVAVQDRQLRAPEVVAAGTLEEKLAAMARLDGTSWAGTVQECAQLLLSTEDGDAVVAQVQQELEQLAQLQEAQ